MNKLLKENANSTPRQPERRTRRSEILFGCGVALLSMALATIARWLLDPYLGEALPYAPYFLAMAVTVWLTDTASSVLAIVVGSLLSNWYFVAPRQSLAISGTANVIDTGLFYFVSLAFLFFARAMRKARARSEANAQTALHKQRDLERLMAEREQAGAALRQSQQEEQQRRVELEALMAAVPAGVWVAHDPECRHITGNPAACEMLKLPPRTNLSKSAPESERPRNYQVFRNGCLCRGEQLPMQTAARTGQPVLGVELEFRFTDGASRWIYGNAVPLRGPDGAVRGAVGVFIDITARKQVDEALRESEARFRAMAETVPDMLFTNRPDGWTDYVTPRFYDYSGLHPGSAEGSGWMAVVHPEDAGRTEAAWRDSIRTGQSLELEYRLRGADGAYRWFVARTRPIRDEQGRILKWVGAATDIEDQKRTAEILEQRVAERTVRLQETVTELEQFSYSITHDMRAPLRAMEGYAHLLLRETCRDCQAEKAKEYLGRIVTAARRMDRLIQDALQFSQVVRTEVRCEPVDAAKLLRGMLTSYPAFQPPQADIRLEGQFPLVLANEAALTQCFSNLLGNAVKFVPPGTVPRVRIWAETRDDWVRLWFADNGIGIAREHQQRIFGMFQQVNKGEEGTGIGLAIVRKAVERMGGRVGVESEPGKGSRFWIELRQGGK